VIFFTMDSIMDILESNISPKPLSAKPVQRTSNYHEKIFQALKAKDHDQAEQIMRKHILQIQKSLEALDGNRQDVKVSRRPGSTGE
jgi:DNA-binding FadR family transcriptional regulator